jgi:cytochrome P450
MEKWTPGRPMRVRAAMQDITLQVISRVVFGHDDDTRLARCDGAWARSWIRVTRPWATLCCPGALGASGPHESVDVLLARRRQFIDRFILDEIRTRRQG